MKALVTNNLTGVTEEIEIEEVEGGQAPEPVAPQAPTVEEMAIALMQTQAELEATTEALDFLIMGGM